MYDQDFSSHFLATNGGENNLKQDDEFKTEDFDEEQNYEKSVQNPTHNQRKQKLQVVRNDDFEIEESTPSIKYAVEFKSEGGDSFTSEGKVQNCTTKNYKCESCGKSFINVKSFRRHIRSLPKDHRDNKCDFCGKSFSYANNLKNHIHTVHEGFKDYKCESCGEAFTREAALKKHIHIVHEGNKDHKCKSCGKSFSNAGHLKNHIHTVHEGHKDHKCEFCGKSWI